MYEIGVVDSGLLAGLGEVDLKGFPRHAETHGRQVKGGGDGEGRRFYEIGVLRHHVVSVSNFQSIDVSIVHL